MIDILFGSSGFFITASSLARWIVVGKRTAKARKLGPHTQVEEQWARAGSGAFKRGKLCQGDQSKNPVLPGSARDIEGAEFGQLLVCQGGAHHPDAVAFVDSEKRAQIHL